MRIYVTLMWEPGPEPRDGSRREELRDVSDHRAPEQRPGFSTAAPPSPIQQGAAKGLRRVTAVPHPDGGLVEPSNSLKISTTFVCESERLRGGRVVNNHCNPRGLVPSSRRCVPYASLAPAAADGTARYGLAKGHTPLTIWEFWESEMSRTATWLAESTNEDGRAKKHVEIRGMVLSSSVWHMAYGSRLDSECRRNWIEEENDNLTECVDVGKDIRDV
uniref:Pyridoxal 5'-phosphate synthase n=1 Tax=Knipowitschia caucasica TaxID=637954 RepID=A0AAV2KLW9_KNICA